MSDYDEGYRAGMQKMREVGQRRIEELEDKLRKSALQELSALDQASEAYQSQLAAEARIEKLEAKLAKAVAELERLGFDFQCIVGRELKGQDDE